MMRIRTVSLFASVEDLVSDVGNKFRKIFPLMSKLQQTLVSLTGSLGGYKNIEFLTDTFRGEAL